VASSFFARNGGVLLRFARQMIVLIVGVTVVVLGIAMLVLPGPAFIVIPLGLGILAAEFHWARRLLDRLKHEGRKALPERWQWLFGKYEHQYEEHERKKHHSHSG
jgi:uncharacterized protein (TIGR02611 family)